jgi:predicted  nucleic acid-binding Zn-ribbon protein
MKETVNLIIGYKRYQLEEEETAKKRKDLESKLAELKESQKSPEDKIKEIEDQLKGLDTTTF